MASPQHPKRQVIYDSPSRDAAYEYASMLCHELAERGDESYKDAEVIRGLAEFLHLSGSIQAKHLNRTKEVDTHDE